MKAMVIIFIVALTEGGFLSAAELSQSQTNPGNGGQTTPTLAQASSSKHPIGKSFEPQVTGALYELSHNGLKALSPFSNYKEGASAQYLSAYPSAIPSRNDRTSLNQPEYGGINLLGWNF